jgi:hypothetical protein
MLVSQFTAYDATLGIGAIHLPVGNPLEDANEDNVELHHTRVAATIGMSTFYASAKRI